MPERGSGGSYHGGKGETGDHTMTNLDSLATPLRSLLAAPATLLSRVATLRQELAALGLPWEVRHSIAAAFAQCESALEDGRTATGTLTDMTTQVSSGTIPSVVVVPRGTCG